MKIYPYQTPEGIIELVEKREYDLLALALQDVVKRMESVPVGELMHLWNTTPWIGPFAKAVRARLIQAAKGEP
jgi:hypothetical protein